MSSSAPPPSGRATDTLPPAAGTDTGTVTTPTIAVSGTGIIVPIRGTTAPHGTMATDGTMARPGTMRATGTITSTGGRAITIR